MKLLGFAAFLVICTPILGGHLSGNARSDDPEMTGPWRNGRYWIQLSEMGKLSYLLGHSEGYLVAALLGYQEYRPVKSLPPALPRQTFGDIVELLDRFYSAPENRNIGVASALRLYRAKIDGQPEADFTAAVDQARRRAAAPTPPNEKK